MITPAIWALHFQRQHLAARPKRVDQTMPLLAAGALRLRRQRQLPIASAAEAHRLLESGEAHEKLVLEA